MGVCLRIDHYFCSVYNVYLRICEMGMFTILIQQENTNQFVGTVKELPIMGKLKAERCEVLIDRFHEEISFLIKDRPDLSKAKIEVEIQVA